MISSEISREIRGFVDGRVSGVVIDSDASGGDRRGTVSGSVLRVELEKVSFPKFDELGTRLSVRAG